MVPFNGTSNRQTNGSKNKNYTPGPGTYSSSYVGFDQIRQNDVNYKTQKDFGMDQMTITGAKQSSNFVSAVPRFQEKKKTTSQNLGPGRYVPRDDWVKENKKLAVVEASKVDMQHAPNPPSIPSHEFVFGYEETKQGILKRQKNPEKVITGLKTDIVGPGQYNIPDTFSKTKKGIVKWKKGSRRKPKFDKSAHLGPGHYQVEKTDIFPIYKYKQSAVFASRVDRATSVQVKKRQRNRIPVGRTRPITAYQNVTKEKSEYFANELSSDDEDAQPGPGFYLDNTKYTSFNTKNVPQRQQYFGSTVERFKEKSRAKPKVGPGSYFNDGVSTAAGTRASSHYNSRKPPFSSSGQRFEVRKSTEEPGPGAYSAADLDKQKENKRILPLSKNRAFGTTERRFTGVKSVETPGPGQYKPESNIKLQDKKRGGGNMKNSSSMFLSSVPRPYEESKKREKAPAVGSYQVQNYTIEENIKKKAGIGFENPLLANLKAKTKANIPFSSEANRFSDKVDEAAAWLAPGYYEHRSGFEENRPKTNKQKAQKFLTKAERFNQQAKTIETPGPGYYNKEEATTKWFKRSYNMIFTE